MLIFAHLGLGIAVSRPFGSGLPRRWLFGGMLAPDLLDKTLYYSQVLATGKHGLELGLISGTRSFGHSALVLILVALIAMRWKIKWLAALALGIASHLLLDNLGDRLAWDDDWTGPGFSPRDGIRAFLWPFLGTQFPVFGHASMDDYAKSYLDRPFFVVTETLGLLLLSWDIWKNRHESEILEFFRKRRLVKNIRRRR